MVIHLLGNSLFDLKSNMHTFSLRLTLQIGIQIVSLLKTIHEKGVIHRDIKPDNFLFGLDENRRQLYVIDFGFCKSYVIDGQHMENRVTAGLIGSLTYASVNAHKNMEQSRRDDLESVGYMLLYFYLGNLDWQYEKDASKICKMKESVVMTLNNQPPIFIDYLNYVKTLEFKETPDYLFLIERMKRENE
jgi:serine/threonine protein kinase